MKRINTIFLIILMILISACAKATPTIEPSPTPLSCLEESDTFLSQSEDLMAKWDDTNQIAGRTSRIGLGPVISDLQDIKREAESIEVPDCSEQIKTAMTSYMSFQIDAYLSFLGMEQDTIVVRKMNDANFYRDEYYRKLAKLQPDLIIVTSPTPIPQPTPVNPLNFVQISPQFTCTADSIGNIIFEGIVRNTSNTYDLQFVKLRVSLVDANGQTISTNSGYIDSDVLFKNSTSTYRIYLNAVSNGTAQCAIAVEDASLK